MRYGERTARGIAAEGGEAVTLEGGKRVRSSKKIIVSRDAMRVIALFGPSAAYAPDIGRKPDRGNGRSQDGTGQGSK